MLDGGKKIWVAESPHSSFKNIFKGYKNVGSKDWAYNHMRLTSPGSSKIKFTYDLPLSSIRQAHPYCKFILKTAYFAPWNMSPCTVTVSINGAKVLNGAQVPGEDKGRTTHESELDADSA